MFGLELAPACFSLPGSPGLFPLAVRPCVPPSVSRVTMDRFPSVDPVPRATFLERRGQPAQSAGRHHLLAGLAGGRGTGFAEEKISSRGGNEDAAPAAAATAAAAAAAAAENSFFRSGGAAVGAAATTAQQPKLSQERPLLRPKNFLLFAH